MHGIVFMLFVLVLVVVVSLLLLFVLYMLDIGVFRLKPTRVLYMLVNSWCKNCVRHFALPKNVCVSTTRRWREGVDPLSRWAADTPCQTAAPCLECGIEIVKCLHEEEMKSCHTYHPVGAVRRVRHCTARCRCPWSSCRPADAPR